jgi:hypothetical protein
VLGVLISAAAPSSRKREGCRPTALYTVSLGWPEIISSMDRTDEDIPYCNTGVKERKCFNLYLASILTAYTNLQNSDFFQLKLISYPDSV